ncbi:MAG: SDR family NAD(P)-dependent oxidoreductase, partial [Kiritimatiellae bacterium]|nr:SDR family NAD(P)-dependent oxidoreductase [Kiritimatiellia bacterium]
MTRRRKLPPTVLVTGGSRRLGAAICTALSSAGYRIALHFNHSEKPALALCRTLAPGSFVVRGDLSTPAGCRSVFAQTLEWTPRIDALVNNAALFLPDDHPSAPLLRPLNYWAPRRLLRLLAAQPGTFPLSCVHLLDARIAASPSPPFLAYTRTKLALARTLRRDALTYA